MLNCGAVDRILWMLWRVVSSDVVRRAHHVTRHNTPIHNILSTAHQLSISQKALGTLPEDGNVMPKHVGFSCVPLNAELNPICHLLALLGGATTVVVSKLRVNYHSTIIRYQIIFISHFLLLTDRWWQSNNISDQSKYINRAGNMPKHAEATIHN